MEETRYEVIPGFYSESQKQRLVEGLSGTEWERCVTLTTKRDYELPDLIGFVRDFIRRIDGITHSRSQYFFGLSGQENLEQERTFSTRLHLHGVIAGVGDITNEQIEGCWRSVEVRFSPSTDLSFTLPNTLGYSKVVHYDGNPDWLFYILNQTRKGEILTNCGGQV
jgi:hypothetical protein